MFASCGAHLSDAAQDGKGALPMGAQSAWPENTLLHLGLAGDRRGRRWKRRIIAAAAARTREAVCGEVALLCLEGIEFRAKRRRHGGALLRGIHRPGEDDFAAGILGGEGALAFVASSFSIAAFSCAVGEYSIESESLNSCGLPFC